MSHSKGDMKLSIWSILKNPRWLPKWPPNRKLDNFAHVSLTNLILECMVGVFLDTDSFKQAMVYIRLDIVKIKTAFHLKYSFRMPFRTVSLFKFRSHAWMLTDVYLPKVLNVSNEMYLLILKSLICSRPIHCL